MRVPSYRLHPTSGQARVTINGRDHLLGPYGSAESKEKYGRLIAEYSASGKSRDFGKKDEFLMENLLLAYLKHAQEYYAGLTEFKNMKLVVRPVLDLYVAGVAVNKQRLVSDSGGNIVINLIHGRSALVSVVTAREGSGDRTAQGARDQSDHPDRSVDCGGNRHAPAGCQSDDGK